MDNFALADFIAGRAQTFTGKELRFLRDELGLTTFDAAEAIGTTPQEIYRLEQVRIEPLPAQVSKNLRELFLSRASSSRPE